MYLNLLGQKSQAANPFIYFLPSKNSLRISFYKLDLIELDNFFLFILFNFGLLGEKGFGTVVFFYYYS